MRRSSAGPAPLAAGAAYCGADSGWALLSLIGICMLGVPPRTFAAREYMSAGALEGDTLWASSCSEAASRLRLTTGGAHAAAVPAAELALHDFLRT
jgi:hypothetical protein